MHLSFLKHFCSNMLPLSGFARLSTNVPLSQCLLPPRLCSIQTRWNKSVFAGRNAPAGQRPSAPRVGACPLRGSRLRARAELGAGAVSPGGVTGRPRAAAGSSTEAAAVPRRGDRAVRPRLPSTRGGGTAPCLAVGAARRRALASSKQFKQDLRTWLLWPGPSPAAGSGFALRSR